jgi:hypothetical protein
MSDEGLYASIREAAAKTMVDSAFRSLRWEGVQEFRREQYRRVADVVLDAAGVPALLQQVETLTEERDHAEAQYVEVVALGAELREKFTACENALVDACEERGRLTLHLHEALDKLSELRSEVEVRDRRITELTAALTSLLDGFSETAPEFWTPAMAKARACVWAIAWCPKCGVERCDYEVTHEGSQFLDACPNCGTEDFPTTDRVAPAGGDTSNPPRYEGTHACIGCGQPYITTTDKLPGYREFCDGCLVAVAKKLAWFFNEPDVDSMMEPAQYALEAIIETAADGSVPEPTTAPADRSKNFNETCGTHGYTNARGMRVGGNEHPDRCVCQGDDTTPHKHYRDAPYSCARCLRCDGYAPAVSGPVSTEGK